MKQTQIGWVIILIIAIIDISILLSKTDPTSVSGAIVITSIVLLLAYKLTIRVTDTHVKFSMGIGIIHGKYKLEDIVYCQPDSYFSMGWGIRLRPGGILYNVSGNKAIELSVRNKSGKIWLGTDHPEELADFINSQRRKQSAEN